MAHEFFGLPSESHEVLSLAVLNGALMFLVPVGLIAYLCWRDKRKARAGVAKPRRRRRRRARPSAGRVNRCGRQDGQPAAARQAQRASRGWRWKQMTETNCLGAGMPTRTGVIS